MKKILILLLLISTICAGQPTTLSSKAEISVITCGPGQNEVYTAFGHSAFRVNDPVNEIDWAYNYGVFNFDQPNFYLNFAKGHLYYQLTVQDYPRFEYVYKYYDRYVHEQVLSLTQDQKQKLFDFLEWNALPENQHYRYDYFYDNCATKMPGVLKKVFGDSVQFDGSHIKTDYTIRELTDRYLTYQPWGDLGIDICLGLPMDKKATPYEYMFLPEYVESGFANATIQGELGRVRLVKQTRIAYEAQEKTIAKTFFQPIVIFGFVFLLIAALSYWDLKRSKLTTAFDVVFFMIIGLVGVLLLLLWVATDHNAAAKNFNLLWALPTHVIAVMAFIKNPKWLKEYFLIVATLSILLLLSWPILPQKLHYALIPLIMAIALRAFTQYQIRKQGSLQGKTNQPQVEIQPK
jgi:hypothetical protein